ncbi:Transcriptional regulator, LysR family [Sinomonas atrocyanea]|uniref:Transcriptional regulator, LysR family n=1 Tax=Sinomonas atrocyanea TaxID=37927 RepID=A0A126ZYS2_9MICC|nr:LysR family transcriptional regulator [Sinomonas atrocyanea]AMM32243.1 Transcriptional regulator, LysR family [Sinomonas atrocyanea]GEB65270.1 LysR family transcriptional regulator [Sinomonas atrocyanea]
MDVRQLQILRELGELGSVKAVAEELMVTPSAVSQQLALLARSAGTQLTRKEGRTLVLTDAGRVLAEAGGAVVRAMADARAAIGAYHEDPAGTVSVCAFHSAAQALFGRLTRRLAAGPGTHDGASPADAGTATPSGAAEPGGAAAPVPRLRLADEDVPQHGFPALTARYDIVLAHRLAHTESWPEDRLVAIPLVREPFDVALPAGHPLAARGELSPEDVAGERWVSSRIGYSPADVLSAIGAVASVSPEVGHRINDYSTVAAVVAGGGGLGLLPRYTATIGLPAGVVLRPLAGIGTQRSIDLLIRPENARRRSVQRVTDALRALMLDLVHEAAAR